MKGDFMYLSYKIKGCIINGVDGRNFPLASF